MANINDPSKRLKSIVTSLHKCVECPVCLETVKTPFKACVRGHCVCTECTTRLEKCPLCQEPLTLDNLICLQHVLEALPSFCRYSDDGCEEIVDPGNDHERFCGYRPIVCRKIGCSVKIPVVQILDHYKREHPQVFICDQESNTVAWGIEPESAGMIHEYTPVFLFGNLFWVLRINDIKEKQLKIYFQATPTGKLEHKYYAQVTFEKDHFVYTYTLKASVLSSCERKFKGKEEDISEPMNLSDEQYCMKIPQRELSNFMDDDDGKLSYSYFFFRV